MSESVAAPLVAYLAVLVTVIGAIRGMTKHASAPLDVERD